MYISIEQAMDIYNELIDAKSGTHEFGSNIAEVYVYKMMPPFYTMYDDGNGFDEHNRLLEKKAAEDFHSICYIFSKKHSVKINIDSLDIHQWICKVRNGEIRFFNKVYIELNKTS